MLRRRLIFFAAAVVFVIAERASFAGSPLPDFVVGQEWSIKSSTAKVVIGRAEEWRGKRVFHVSIMDVPIPKGMAGEGTMTIEHMPFEGSVLGASVDRLLAIDVSPSPGFENGYQQWQSEKGGIFTVGVLKAIEFALGAADLRRGG